MSLKAYVVIFLAAQLAQCISSPNELGSDLTLLINNDLLGSDSPSADSGIIVLTPRSRTSAAVACAALGEKLWEPELKTASIQSNLDYLVLYSNFSADQQFWISSSPTSARSIDGHGKMFDTATTLSAHQILPAICTQSAPFSNSSYQNTSSQWQITVHSNNEYITGFRDRLSFRFLGIRYAPHPKRFTYSTPYKGAGGNSSAIAYGPQCMQSGGGSEDCLFLNIWTPFLPAHGGARQGLKPVLFWIHGGAFTGGTGNDPTFDGGNIVSRGDVVMVAINYRLSTLGFLALDDGITKGNFGFADQINALDWVQNNIQNFGGDPDRITIFGQSAGAASVRALMASPKAAGKFAAAIPQSNLGGGGYGTTYSAWLSTGAELITAANSILNTTNCSTAASKVDCLRDIPAATLVKGTVARYLVVDGTYLNSSTLILNGTTTSPLANVHLMEGLMRDDGAAIISYVQTTNLSNSLTGVGFQPEVIIPSGLFPQPKSTNTSLDVFNVTARVATNSIFRCIDQASSYAGVLNRVFAPNQYFYEFNRSYQTPSWNPNPPVCEAPKSRSSPNGDPDQEYFKCHSGELYFEFGNILRMGLPLRDDNDLPFSQFVLDTWASFARSYNPNPDRAFLKSRGYTNTTMELDLAGDWQPVKGPTWSMRQLQWPSLQVPFRDVVQCTKLGWPLDYYSPL